MAKVLSVAIWVVLVALMADAYYLNHDTPRGPMYATGDVVCMNDDRDCGPEQKEDVSNLDLPDWQKWLKLYWLLLALPLAVGGIVISQSAWGPARPN